MTPAGFVGEDRPALTDLQNCIHCGFCLPACPTYIATGQELTVRDLANVFGAFRWGGLLRQHCTSAMDFPYSVAGLTADHVHMRWPNIDEPNAPDKPGSRFRQPFGAVPVVLSLNYQALM